MAITSWLTPSWRGCALYAGDSGLNLAPSIVPTVIKHCGSTCPLPNPEDRCDVNDAQSALLLAAACADQSCAGGYVLRLRTWHHCIIHSTGAPGHPRLSAKPTREKGGYVERRTRGLRSRSHTCRVGSRPMTSSRRGMRVRPVGGLGGPYWPESELRAAVRVGSGVRTRRLRRSSRDQPAGGAPR